MSRKNWNRRDWWCPTHNIELPITKSVCPVGGTECPSSYLKYFDMYFWCEEHNTKLIPTERICGLVLKSCCPHGKGCKGIWKKDEVVPNE
jgi:hypothetical protein